MVKESNWWISLNKEVTVYKRWLNCILLTPSYSIKMNVQQCKWGSVENWDVRSTIPYSFKKSGKKSTSLLGGGSKNCRLDWGKCSQKTILNLGYNFIMMYKYVIVAYFILDLFTSSLELLESGKKSIPQPREGAKLKIGAKGSGKKSIPCSINFFKTKIFSKRN